MTFRSEHVESINEEVILVTPSNIQWKLPGWKLILASIITHNNS
jgi:hypothetical protein